MQAVSDTHVNLFNQMLLGGTAARRLFVACILGGAVGLERERRHKDSGLRTNMLICMGAALFTIMSEVLAGDSPNKGQVASNIVQGVGFLGAGLILHTRNRVIGLTSAATVFVVAAIGMTCGGGLYVEALIATLLLLIALKVVGNMEVHLGWRRYSMLYEVRAEIGAIVPEEVVGAERAEAVARNVEAARFRMLQAVLKVLDAAGHPLRIQQRDNVAGMERVCFSMMATRKTHAQVLEQLRASDATDQVIQFRDLEEE